MAKVSKRMQAIREKVDSERLYGVDEALQLLKDVASAKFNESIEVSVNLGVDPRKSDQTVRGATVLPHGTGKSARVIVFANGDKELEARDAGADFVGGDDLAKKINDGWLDFD